MKYKVIEQLEIRSEPSLTSGQSFGILKPGFLFDVLEEVTINGKTFLVDSNGFYYLKKSCKVSEPEAVIHHSGSNVKIDWNKEIKGIPKEWRETFGKGIKVAILDSGIASNHADLSHQIESDNCVDKSGSGTNEDQHRDGHGTHCAGLVAAKSSGRTGISGIAPDCELFFAKIQHPNAGIISASISQGIQWAIEKGVHVINLSIGDYIEGKHIEVKEAIASATQKGIIVVGAAGNDQVLENQYYYPAFYDECIAVGAISERYFRNHGTSRINHSVDLILPYSDILSCSTAANNFYLRLKGSSMATAMITGVIALWLSFTNLHQLPGWQISKARSALKNLAIPINNIIFDPQHSISVYKL